MLNTQIAFWGRRFGSDIESPKLGPERVFVSGNALPNPFVFCPGFYHGAQTKTIWIGHVLVKAGIKSAVSQKSQSQLDHYSKESDQVFWSDLDLHRGSDRAVISLMREIINWT